MVFESKDSPTVREGELPPTDLCIICGGDFKNYPAVPGRQFHHQCVRCPSCDDHFVLFSLPTGEPGTREFVVLMCGACGNRWRKEGIRN